ncbi:MAG TPA: hypothetical protein VNH46_02080, partial [Gemmatimonadales bacterium]|nr:hypothetical protein [Gemmatimonadales bacterium]
ARVAEAFPAVRVLAAPAGTTIPQMRAMAFEVATGENVAVIEDHVRVPRGWARAMLAAQARGEEVVGGAVENAATEKLVDWAAFLCEYSQLIPPLPAGPVPGLTGNNTVYRRARLERYGEVWRAGRWENHLHDALRRDGVTLYQHPEIVVGHKKHYTVGEYLSQRYLYARSYAGARVAGEPAWKRLAYGLAALLLPPLLYRRVVATVWGKGRHRRELIRSLPLLALFVSAWGTGELVGYWFGPGDALGRVT